MFLSLFVAYTRLFAIALLAYSYGLHGNPWSLVACVGFTLSAAIGYVALLTQRETSTKEDR